MEDHYHIYAELKFPATSIKEFPPTEQACRSI